MPQLSSHTLLCGVGALVFGDRAVIVPNETADHFAGFGVLVFEVLHMDTIVVKEIPDELHDAAFRAKGLAIDDVVQLFVVVEKRQRLLEDECVIGIESTQDGNVSWRLGFGHFRSHNGCLGGTAYRIDSAIYTSRSKSDRR